jgi:hypothetical protein
LSRPNWSRPLPRPLKIPDIMTLRTLADVRSLLNHVPAQRRHLDTWRHVAKCLNDVLPAAATLRAPSSRCGWCSCSNTCPANRNDRPGNLGRLEVHCHFERWEVDGAFEPIAAHFT